MTSEEVNKCNIVIEGHLPPGNPLRGPRRGRRERGQEGLQAPRALHGVHAPGP